MNKTMQAAVLLGEKHLELREVPVPQPGAGEVLVRVRAATTCGTDVKTYTRGHPKFPPPFVFGHEFGGDIVALGSGVTGFEPGMRLTANVFAECGQCVYCRKGQGNLCQHLVYNFGAFAEYNLVPASIVKRTAFVIPEHIGYAQAAVVEPLVCVVHAQDFLEVHPGDVVAIIGAGGSIGLLHQQLAQLRQARVVAIGHNDKRLAVARSCGAEQVVNARSGDPYAVVMELTGGLGADVVIECAGRKEAWQEAVRLVRRGGQVLWFGGLPGGTTVELDATRLHYDQITLYNTHGGTAEDARRAFDLIVEGKIDVEPLFSGELPLAQVEEALQRMIDGDAIKMVIRP